MEEVIVEGLDYEDFVTIKNILINNTSFKYNQKDLVYDYLVHFREPEVVISLDGFGDRGEYVRWGLKEKNG